MRMTVVHACLVTHCNCIVHCNFEDPKLYDIGISDAGFQSLAVRVKNIASERFVRTLGFYHVRMA